MSKRYVASPIALEIADHALPLPPLICLQVSFPNHHGDSSVCKDVGGLGVSCGFAPQGREFCVVRSRISHEAWVADLAFSKEKKARGSAFLVLNCFLCLRRNFVLIQGDSERNHLEPITDFSRRYIPPQMANPYAPS